MTCQKTMFPRNRWREIQDIATLSFHADIKLSRHDFKYSKHKLYNMKVTGIVLIVIGVLMIVFGSVSFTHEKKVVDVGPVEINKKQRKTIAWPNYAGGIAIAAGVIVLVAGRKKDA
jgi:uncharacterized membrane protein YidH (DUF202 family)